MSFREPPTKTLVIGVAGTGKSILAREMQRRGLNAVDADEGLATFVDKEGNEVQYDPGGGDRWWSSHYYVLKPGTLQALLREDGSVWVFGDVGGEPGKGNGLVDMVQLFDRVCYLKASERMIQNRLAKRTDNPFGKNQEEVRSTLERKKELDRVAEAMKFEIIDAGLRVDEIASILGLST